MADEVDVKKLGDDGKVEVSVNEKPVVLDGVEQTGASVKKAAVEQGVKIAEDFELIIELGDGKTKLVGDDEKIAVHAGERFIAVEKDIEVEVSVNDKPVVLKGVRQTGASVKRAAIAEGVRIGEDFVLSIELGGGKTKLVGDDDEIVIRAGERFLAIENDDNS
ncbi:MAG: multiubiquitin domain-containing protein [Rhodospirillaceae bacterium]|nr:multiubiquitin domain-containing protein [Rhodospirillaceae bacterium]